MISINLPKNLTFGMKILYGLLAVSIVTVIVCVIIFNRNTYLAKTMKLVRAEGTVKVEQEGGKLKQIKKNARFSSGEALTTGAGSLASVSLDDTKIITLQADSRAEFTKMNKQLALKLTKGGLFFEVTEKLNADELFEIKTSTITAGIKGTSGYFYIDEEGNDTLTVTDGNVIISAVNPETGERKYAEVNGGQRLVVHLYSDSDKDHDSIELDVIDLAEEDLEDFTLKKLGENERLLTKVCEYTGWDRTKLRELINALIVANISSGETTPSSEDSSEPESSSETQSVEDNTPTPTPKTEETDKPEATATPKPKATTAPKGKATATPKPKAKATTAPKQTTATNADPTQGGGGEPTQGGGGEPTQGGGGEPTQGGGGEPTQGGGGEPTQGGGGEPTQGGGGEPTQGGGGEPTQGGSNSGGGEPTQGGGSNNVENTTP